MSDPVWPGIAALLVYISAAVTLGVASNRLKREKVLLISFILICSGVLAVALAHLGWHFGWRELLATVASAFTWFGFALAVVFAIPFMVGRYVARLVLKARPAKL